MDTGGDWLFCKRCPLWSLKARRWIFDWIDICLEVFAVALSSWYWSALVNSLLVILFSVFFYVQTESLHSFDHSEIEYRW